MIDRSLGIVKAYSTRVGTGGFPTEIEGDLADQIRTVGNEFGVVTGRPRRIG
jgi:adenylosuccinate synthase